MTRPGERRPFATRHGFMHHDPHPVNLPTQTVSDWVKDSKNCWLVLSLTFVSPPYHLILVSYALDGTETRTSSTTFKLVPTLVT